MMKVTKRVIYQVIVALTLLLVGLPLCAVEDARGAPKKAVWIFNISDRPAQVQILRGTTDKLMDATLNPVGSENIIVLIEETSSNIKKIILRLNTTYLIKIRYQGEVQWTQRTFRLTRTTISYLFVLSQ